MDPRKLEYILERAADDERIEQFARWQRGELSQEEVETLLASKEPDAAVLRELYRPLDDLEKQRLLRAAVRRKPARWLVAAAVAAILALVVIQRLIQPEPVQVAVHTDAAMLVNNQPTLGAADTSAQPVVDLGGCLAPVVMAGQKEGRLGPSEQVLTFFQRGAEVVFWPVEFTYQESTGDLRSRVSCAPIPTAGLTAGTWDIVVVHGRSLPSVAQAEAVLRGGRRPPWARWNIARIPVQLRSLGH